MAKAIPQQRLVFLVKNLASQLGQGNTSPAVTAEVLKLLKVVLPIIKGIYGSHWAEILDFMTTMWSQMPSMDSLKLPLVHASLRLHATMRSLVGHDDGNEDLDDAWKEAIGSLSEGLVNLLIHSAAGKMSIGW